MTTFSQNLWKYFNTLTNGPSPWSCPRRSAHYKEGRCSYEDSSKLRKCRGTWQRSEPNPEYHCAPRCYVKNFRKHLDEQVQEKGISGHDQRLISYRNPRYRWLDFRRRMVYGTYDI